MPLSRNKLYAVLFIACFAGYVWLYVNAFTPYFAQNDQSAVCFIKHVTNIPCPSCGSTRSVLFILQGHFLQALAINPLGFLLIILLLLIPCWMLYDFFKQKNTLLEFFQKAEIRLKQKRIAIPAIILLLANWFWNIYKGL
jgi:hypothetical protein